MFKADTPMYLRGISPGVEVVDQETRKTLTLSFLLQPFTREHADDLGVGAELFEGSTGNPNDLVAEAKLRISPPDQRMAFRMAPDAPACTLVINDVEVLKVIKVRADKEGPVLSGHLNVKLRYPSGADLLAIMSAYTEQRWVTFVPQQNALPLDEAPRRARRPPPPQPDSNGSSASA